MGESGRAVISIVSSVLGLAIISVVLSNRANTSGVIGAGGSALASVISAATAPVTGASTSGFNTASLFGNTSSLFGNLGNSSSLFGLG